MKKSNTGNFIDKFFAIFVAAGISFLGITLIFLVVVTICSLISTDLIGCEKTGNQQSQTVVQYITVGKLTTPIVTAVTHEEYICKDGKKLWN